MRPVGKWLLILGVAVFVLSAGFFAVANLFSDSAIVSSIWDSIPDAAGLFLYCGYWCIGPVLMLVGGVLYCAAKPICTIEDKAEDNPR